MNPYLFVYGTLLRTVSSPVGRAERARLEREATSLGPATTRGRLYDLGDYPGLVPSDDPRGLVHGEALATADPACLFEWLDAYEGIAACWHDDYERILRTVTLASIGDMTAWIYAYRKDSSKALFIPSGRWA